MFAGQPFFVWFVVGAMAIFGVVLGGVSYFTRDH
jgi:hypothetical protein